jgi:hypothetical protein
MKLNLKESKSVLLTVGIGVGVSLAIIAGLSGIGTTSSLVSGSGKNTPYVTDFWSDRVYFRSWSGDGLGGSYTYYHLPGVSKENLTFHDLSIDGRLFSLLQYENGFFLHQYKLPFNPLEERIRGVTGRANVVLWTERRVFFGAEQELSETVGAKGDSFRPFDDNDYYFRDSDRVYYLEFGRGLRAIEGLKTQGLRAAASYGYITDGDVVAFEGKLIDGADGATISDIRAFEDTEMYAADKNGVYYRGKRIEGVDLESFAVMGRISHAFDTTLMKDKHAIYFRGKKVSEIDRDSARIVEGEESYLTDKSGVRFKAEFDRSLREYVLKR